MHVAYVALDDSGQEVRGGLDALDLSEAAALLRGRGLFPVELDEAPAEGGASVDPGGGRWPGFVRSSDLVLFCNQMSLMLRTGLTLLQALETLATRLGKAPLRRAARRMSVSVQSGAPLSRAIEEEGRLFPPLVAQLVRTAEATGELESAFARAGDYLERRAALRAQLVTSLIYPSVVVLVSAGVFWFLTTRVIPRFAEFLAGRQVALPWTTQLLLDVSDVLRAYGPALLVGLAGGAAAFVLSYRSARGRTVVDRAVLAVPVVGGLLRAAAMAHLSRTFALLLRSGLPLLEALRLLGETFTNRTYTGALEAARERVARGEGLTEALQGPGISPLCTQVLGVGEQTGALDAVLEELAEFYDLRLRQHVRTLASLVEPALLLVIGAMVAFVYIGFFQAVFQLVR